MDYINLKDSRGILRKPRMEDFDSAMRRFESSRPSQPFVFACSYLASDVFGSSISFRTLICPSFRTFVAGSFARRCAWRLRVADNARSKVSFAYPRYACAVLCPDKARPCPSVRAASSNSVMPPCRHASSVKWDGNPIALRICCTIFSKPLFENGL
jgi:hypothetical protein